MATSKLPRTITKSDLLDKAQGRFREWIDMYADSYISIEQMYEDMSCSIYTGDPAWDFPDNAKTVQDSDIRYHYKYDGNCYFIVDGIEIEVYDLRSMREAQYAGKETYTDVCVLFISYTDSDGNLMGHLIPDAWLYGSTSKAFEEGAKVHQGFIDVARKYIKKHSVTKEMQEVQ